MSSEKQKLEKNNNKKRFLFKKKKFLDRCFVPFGDLIANCSLFLQWGTTAFLIILWGTGIAKWYSGGLVIERSQVHFLQGQLSVMTLISVSVHPSFYRKISRPFGKCAGCWLQLNTQVPDVCCFE